jgi:hypothetical protein
MSGGQAVAGPGHPARRRPVVVAVAALQVAVPVSMLVARWATEGTRPVSELPASFQMYSAEPPVSYTGTDGDGRARPLDVSDLPIVLRAVDSGNVLPRRLCERHPDLVAVERRGGLPPATYRC